MLFARKRGYLLRKCTISTGKISHASLKVWQKHSLLMDFSKFSKSYANYPLRAELCDFASTHNSGSPVEMRFCANVWQLNPEMFIFLDETGFVYIPPRNFPSTIRGESMDIFWNHTFCNLSILYTWQTVIIFLLICGSTQICKKCTMKILSFRCLHWEDKRLSRTSGYSFRGMRAEFRRLDKTGPPELRLFWLYLQKECWTSASIMATWAAHSVS